MIFNTLNVIENKSIVIGSKWVKSDLQEGIVGLCYGDGVWIAWTNSTNCRVYYSYNGKEWIIGSGLADSVYISIVKYGGGLFVAGTSSGIYYSEDGKIWSSSNITTGSQQLISYAFGKWYVHGFNGYYVSDDGKTYNSTTLVSNWSKFIKEYKDLLIIQQAHNGIYYSEDRSTRSNTNISTYGSGVFDLAYKFKGVLISGTNDSYIKGFYYSEDGKTWTQSNVTDIGLVGICQGIGVCVCIARANRTNSTDGNAYYSRLYYSLDGKSWTKTMEFNYESSNNFSGSVEYCEGVFIATINRTVYYSKDGIDWVEVSQDSDGVTWDSLSMILSTADGKALLACSNGGVWISSQDV